MAEEVKRTFRNDHDIEFWRDAAISAMQGIQESGWKLLGAFADIDKADTANIAFDMADAMLEEYHKRLDDADFPVESINVFD
jgi:hypothetical protein